MTRSALSGFWKAGHVERPSMEEFSGEVAALSKQSWGNFTPDDLNRLLITFGNFLNGYRIGTELYDKTKELWFRKLERKAFQTIWSKSGLGKTTQFSTEDRIRCLKSIAKLQITVNEKNASLFKLSISSLLRGCIKEIESLSASNLSDFAGVMTDMGLQISYVGLIPSDNVMYLFFKQTAKVMSVNNYSFDIQHFTTIAKMCDDLAITPPDDFIEVAQKWCATQTPSTGLNHAMKKLEELAFNTHFRRTNPSLARNYL